MGGWLQLKGVRCFTAMERHEGKRSCDFESSGTARSIDIGPELSAIVLNEFGQAW